MNPQTDISHKVHLPDGRIVTAHLPGAKLTNSSRNWRLTEAAFRRYEGHIRAAVDNWPRETAFEVPAGMSPNTFEHRLRDALQALKAYRYDEQLFARLSAIREELVVSQDLSGTKVWIRAKGNKGRPVQLKQTPHAPSAPVVLNAVHDLPTKDGLAAWCLLLSSGQVDGPVQFRGEIDATWVAELESKFDVGFAFDKTTGLTIVL